MRFRILCMVCCVCAYVKIFRGAFYKTSYRYAKILIHGMIYLEGQVNCKRVCESWKEDVQHQRLVHFLNHGHMDVNAVNTRRVEQLLPFVLQSPQNRGDRLHEYLLFSIDPSDFKKYKKRQTQGVHSPFAYFSINCSPLRRFLRMFWQCQVVFERNLVLNVSNQFVANHAQKAA